MSFVYVKQVSQWKNTLLVIYVISSVGQLLTLQPFTNSVCIYSIPLVSYTDYIHRYISGQQNSTWPTVIHLCNDW